MTDHPRLNHRPDQALLAASERRRAAVQYVRDLEACLDDWVFVAHAWRRVAIAMTLVAVGELVVIVVRS